MKILTFGVDPDAEINVPPEPPSEPVDIDEELRLLIEAHKGTEVPRVRIISVRPTP